MKLQFCQTGIPSIEEDHKREILRLSIGVHIYSVHRQQSIGLHAGKQVGSMPNEMAQKVSNIGFLDVLPY